jgi:hypothetical protein
MNFIPDYPATARPISAADAIAPAFRRARSILGVPFRLGFFLKICFFAALTESGFFTASFSYPIQGASAASQAGVHHMQSAPADNFVASAIGPLGALGAGVILLILAAAIVGLILWAIVTYLFCRLRLTVLDLAIYREGLIRRAWRKYSRQAWRYFGLTILTMLVFLVILAAVIGPFIPAFIRITRSMDPTHPDPFAILGLMLPLFAAILSLSLLGVIVDAVIRDFLLPPMIVEDASIESSLRRFFRMLRHEPGQTSLYIFLRILMSMVFATGLSIIFLIPVIMLALVAILIGFPLYHALWQGGAQVLFVLYVVGAGCCILTLYFLAITVVFGATSIFKLCYAVTFYGARYPELNNLLDPPPPAPEAALPPTPPPSDAPPLPPFPQPATDPPPLW